jgi:hypothetical protein
MRLGAGEMDWVAPVQDRDKYQAFVHVVMNLPFPQNVGNFLTSSGSLSFSRRALLHGIIIYLFIYLSVYLVS